MKTATFFAYLLTGAITFAIGITATLPFYSAAEIPKRTQAEEGGLLPSDPGFSQFGTFDQTGRYDLEQNFDGAFANFKYLDIPAMTFGYDSKGRRIEAKAFVNESETGFDVLLIDEDRIMFQTPVVRGERYVFMGSFRRATRCGVDLATSGIDGYLAKFSEGRLVASRRASFSTVHGC